MIIDVFIKVLKVLLLSLALTHFYENANYKSESLPRTL